VYPFAVFSEGNHGKRSRRLRLLRVIDEDVDVEVMGTAIVDKL
jgi:hypothetical protein